MRTLLVSRRCFAVMSLLAAFSVGGPPWSGEHASPGMKKKGDESKEMRGPGTKGFVKLYNEGKYTECIKKGEAILAEYPDRCLSLPHVHVVALAHNALGQDEASRQRIIQGLENARKLIDANPDAPWLPYFKSTVASVVVGFQVRDEKWVDLAKQYCKEILATDLSKNYFEDEAKAISERAEFSRAEVMFLAGDTDEAFRAYTKMLENEGHVSPRRMVIVLKRLGDIHRARGHSEKAEEAYQQVLALVTESKLHTDAYLKWTPLWRDLKKETEQGLKALKTGPEEAD